MLYDSGKIEKINFEIYTKWFDEFIEEFNNFHYIYIKTNPEKALERINKRARPGETIPLEYLKECDKYHNNWLETIESTNIITLDGNIDRNNNDSYYEWFDIINTFIAKNV
jgi:deoxycitidine kinase/deoxyguanosine kinase